MENADLEKIFLNDKCFAESSEVAVHARVLQNNVPKNFYNFEACIFIIKKYFVAGVSPGRYMKFFRKVVFP